MLRALILVQLAVPAPVLHIENPQGVAHPMTLRASWPLPRSASAPWLGAVTVGDVDAAWRPLARWPDGDLALVELRWNESVPIAGSRRVAIRWEATAAGDGEVSTLPLDLPLRAELEDPWGRTYTAPLGAGELVEPAGRRWSTFSTSADGVRFLGIEATLEPGYTARHAILTMVLDNGRLRPDDAPGAVRLRRLDLISETPSLRFLPRFARANTLTVARPELDADGATRGYRQPLLGPSDAIYLGDGTAKAFRFDLFWSDGATEAETAAVAAAVASPIVVFPDLTWVRYTRAFGLHGGPAPVLGDNERIGAMLAGAWHSSADMGPFGGFGDPKPAAAHGAPRHGASALHSVLRLRSPALLGVAEAMFLQGLLRPLPGHVVRAPADAQALRQGVSRRAQARPHGFEPLDYEHVSVDLLFDVYWLTGDRLALAELRRYGTAIRALLTGRSFQTSRGEGLGILALASVVRATGDRDLADWLLAHVRSRVLPRLHEHPVAAIAQPPHREVLDGVSPFDSPWQMALLVHGLHAVYAVTDDTEVAAAAIAVATRMAGPGWLERVGPKYFVSANDAARFEMAREGAPAAGPGRFELGAFVLAAELARSQPALAAVFEGRARELMRALTDAALAVPPGLRSDPWVQLWLDRQEPLGAPR